MSFYQCPGTATYGEGELVWDLPTFACVQVLHEIWFKNIHRCPTPCEFQQQRARIGAARCVWAWTHNSDWWSTTRFNGTAWSHLALLWVFPPKKCLLKYNTNQQFSKWTHLKMKSYSNVSHPHRRRCCGDWVQCKTFVCCCDACVFSLLAKGIHLTHKQ